MGLNTEPESERLYFISYQKWHSYMNEIPKALHYKHFKSLLTAELYLNTDLSYVLKKTLSNFRCSYFTYIFSQTNGVFRFNGG